MEILASKRMESMMLVAALILWSSIGADAASLACKVKCAVLCIEDPLPLLCSVKCIRDCPDKSLMSPASKHCDAGCFLSTCLDYHPDTKKIGVDMKKVGACADSCSQGCQKTYPLH